MLFDKIIEDISAIFDEFLGLSRTLLNLIEKDLQEISKIHKELGQKIKVTLDEYHILSFKHKISSMSLIHLLSKLRKGNTASKIVQNFYKILENIDIQSLSPATILEPQKAINFLVNMANNISFIYEEILNNILKIKDILIFSYPKNYLKIIEKLNLLKIIIYKNLESETNITSALDILNQLIYKINIFYTIINLLIKFYGDIILLYSLYIDFNSSTKKDELENLFNHIKNISNKDILNLLEKITFDDLIDTLFVVHLSSIFPTMIARSIQGAMFHYEHFIRYLYGYYNQVAIENPYMPIWLKILVSIDLQLYTASLIYVMSYPILLRVVDGVTIFILRKIYEDAFDSWRFMEILARILLSYESKQEDYLQVLYSFAEKFFNVLPEPYDAIIIGFILGVAGNKLIYYLFEKVKISVDIPNLINDLGALKISFTTLGRDTNLCQSLIRCIKNSLPIDLMNLMLVDILPLGALTEMPISSAINIELFSTFAILPYVVLRGDIVGLLTLGKKLQQLAHAQAGQFESFILKELA